MPLVINHLCDILSIVFNVGQTPKRHSVICLSSHVSSNVRVTVDPHPVLSRGAAASSSHHDRSCDTNAVPTTSGHVTGVPPMEEVSEWYNG